MLKVFKKVTASELSDTSIEAITESIVIPYDIRKKGRFKAISEAGTEVGVFLERGNVLTNDDILIAESGEKISIKSAAEEVTTVHCDDWLTFSRLCYHLGNRHVPLQVGERWLRLMPDYVLEDLARSFGAEVVHEKACFQPENGAYGKHGGHHHHHDDEEEHEHAHSHQHSHSHDHKHSHERVESSPERLEGKESHA